MTTATTESYTPDTMLDTEAAADVLGLRPQTLNEWRCRRVGPSFAKLGRAVRYRYADLVAWIESQRVETH